MHYVADRPAAGAFAVADWRHVVHSIVGHLAADSALAVFAFDLIGTAADSPVEAVYVEHLMGLHKPHLCSDLVHELGYLVATTDQNRMKIGFSAFVPIVVLNRSKFH